MKNSTILTSDLKEVKDVLVTCGLNEVPYTQIMHLRGIGSFITASGYQYFYSL